MPQRTSRAWFAGGATDKFTDDESLFVTIGSFYTAGDVFDVSGMYYPFVQIKKGTLRVGVRAGLNTMPVGDVQLRIDKMDAWTITTSETPLDYVPDSSRAALVESVNKRGGDAAAADATYAITMENMTRAMSPFTAATGDKARAILKQMWMGKKLLYRTVGLNQAASSVGEIGLGATFRTAMNQSGILKHVD